MVRKIAFLILALFFFIASGNAQLEGLYLGGGYNFSHTALRGANRFIDAYNRDPYKASGYVMDEQMKHIHGIKGHNFVFGYMLETGIIEINWTRKYDEVFAHYSNPFAQREVSFKTRTFGLGYLHHIYEAPEIRTNIYAGGHMDFIKAMLFTRVKYSEPDVPWQELKTEGRGNFSLISPTLKFIVTPFEKIPLSLGINFYWQMCMGRHDFSSMNDVMTNNWQDPATMDSLISSGGNVGVVFQVLLFPFRAKFEFPEREEEPEPEPDVTDISIKGNVLDSATGNHINATMSVKKTDSYNIETEVVRSLDVAGLYKITVPKSPAYTFSIEAFGYEPIEEKLNFYDYNTNIIEKDFKLKKIKVGTAVKLNNIYFKKASAELLSESFPELNKLYDYLKNNSSVEIEIAGHTSSEGTDEYNQNLSQNRAESVRAYLVKKGISDSRITAKGYGEKQPVADNETEEGRILNRRVEFVILKN